MAGRSYGTVTKAGAANMAASGMTHRGPSRKKVVTGGKRQANPAGSIRSAASPIKGADRGAG